MRKGITQDQVNAAADALVVAREKPTVERIRAQLGTGSPNTVLRMLETWRGALAQRLQDVMQLPEMPTEVGQAAATLWKQALIHAEAITKERLTSEFNALSQAQADLADERAQWMVTLESARAEIVAAVQARDQTQIRLDEQQRLIALLERQADEHGQQHDLLQAQYETLQADRDALRQRLEAFEATMTAERTVTVQHVRAVEDRAHGEVDRAREDLKRQRQDATQRDRQQQRELKAVTQRGERVENQRREAEQTITELTTRLKAMTAAATKHVSAGRKTLQEPKVQAASRKKPISKETGAKGQKSRRNSPAEH